MKQKCDAQSLFFFYTVTVWEQSSVKRSELERNNGSILWCTTNCKWRRLASVIVQSYHKSLHFRLLNWLSSKFWVLLQSYGSLPSWCFHLIGWKSRDAVIILLKNALCLAYLYIIILPQWLRFPSVQYMYQEENKKDSVLTCGHFQVTSSVLNLRGCSSRVYIYVVVKSSKPQELT